MGYGRNTSPWGVIVGSIKNIFMSAYFAACMAAVVYVPLFVLHGYRHWWLDALYALMAVTAAAGSISHYRTERRNRKS
jgi:Cu/Ag efflux pump CusA